MHMLPRQSSYLSTMQPNGLRSGQMTFFHCKTQTYADYLESAP